MIDTTKYTTIAMMSFSKNHDSQLSLWNERKRSNRPICLRCVLRLIGYSILLTSQLVDLKVKGFAIEAGGLRFHSRASQIGRSAATSATFLRSCVVQALRPRSHKEVFATRYKTSFCYCRRYFNSFRTCFSDSKTEIVTYPNC